MGPLSPPVDPARRRISRVARTAFGKEQRPGLRERADLLRVPAQELAEQLGPVLTVTGRTPAHLVAAGREARRGAYDRPRSPAAVLDRGEQRPLPRERAEESLF